MAICKGARLKIERANKHVKDIEARISALPDSNIAPIHTDPNTGVQAIKHEIGDCSAALTDIAVMIGDAVHNFKCALDYAWLHAITTHLPDAVGKFAKLPVYPSREELEGVLTGRKIDTASPDLFGLVMTEIQPYNGGNHAIWSVHKLNILDKHRLILPVVNYLSIHGVEFKNESGEIESGNTWGTTQQPPWYIQIPTGWHVKNKGKMSINVLFGEGTPIRHIDVSGQLNYFSHVIVEVVKMLENV